MPEWTYGVELEWPDVDVRTPLPAGWGWSRTDYTIVNSDGVANDPKHELVLRGGELNSPVAAGPEELECYARELAALLNPGRNYRSNLHIHIGVPELLSDLDAVKQVAEWMRRILPGVLAAADPLDGLLEGVRGNEAAAGARMRMRHSERSRHHFISETRHIVRMTAPTLEAFLRAEVPSRRDGTPCWALEPREAVNLRSLRKHGTVEFRCFAGDNRGAGVAAAAWLATQLLELALDGGSGGVVLPAGLPTQLPYVHELERGWERTNLKHNRRDKVRQLLADAGKLGA